jgi:hypothetical protein
MRVMAGLLGCRCHSFGEAKGCEGIVLLTQKRVTKETFVYIATKRSKVSLSPRALIAQENRPIRGK